MDNEPVATQDNPCVPALLAAVDIGSNSFRLEIGRVVAGRYRRV